MTEAATSYAAVVAAVGELARGLDDDQLSAPVLASPEWTVHDVLAHLAGSAADQVSGRMDGVPGPEWTGRHVAERSATSVADLLAELGEHATVIGARLADGAWPGTLWDVSTHLADLHETLGRGRPAEALWAPSLAGARERLGEHAEALAGVDDYEVFRALFSRRSRAQMRAWGTSLTAEQLDEIPVFEPRDDDQPAPRF